MNGKLRVLYVIYLDKFTKNFADFLQEQFPEIDAKFIIYGKKKQFEFEADTKNLVYVDSYRNVNKCTDAYKWAEASDLIVFSGVFGSEKLLMKFPKGSAKKACFHFWGGDFYDLRDKIPFYKVKAGLSKAIKINYFRKAKAVINLIPGDYDELQKIVKTDAPHYIAPVCESQNSTDAFAPLFSTNKSASPVKICLGNSATKTNEHMEVLDLLEKFKNEDIQIICPLSYGDKEYAGKVIERGKSIFKDKFCPLTDYMSKDDYFKLLSDCRIGIFNNNRQQGMGNIVALLSMGSKIYIKSSTSMWQRYVNERQYTVFDVQDIAKSDFEGFTAFDEAAAVSNVDKMRYYCSAEYKKSLWDNFFNSVCSDAAEK